MLKEIENNATVDKDSLLDYLEHFHCLINDSDSTTAQVIHYKSHIGEVLLCMYNMFLIEVEEYGKYCSYFLGEHFDFMEGKLDNGQF